MCLVKLSVRKSFCSLELSKQGRMSAIRIIIYLVEKCKVGRILHFEN